MRSIYLTDLTRKQQKEQDEMAKTFPEDYRLKNEDLTAFPWNQSGEPGLTKLEYAAIHIAAGMAASPNPPPGGIIAAAYHTARGLLAQCEEAQ